MDYDLNDHTPTWAGIGAAWALFLMLGLALASPALLDRSVRVGQASLAKVVHLLPGSCPG